MPSARDAPTNADDASSRHRRSLWLYRAIIAALIVALVALVLAPKRSAPIELEVFDVGAYVDGAPIEHPGWPDMVSSPYFQSATGSVHAHVMAPRQICPLHLHEATEEATVIVSGTADVTFVHEKDGSLSERPERFAPGSVVYSPKYCGHEWHNRGDAPLGNLVFTAPKFAGNLYVRRDDPLLLRGTAPTSIPPDGGGPGRRESKLPFAGERLRVLSIDAPETLAAGASATIVYCIGGAGTFDAGGSVDLAPKRLAVLRVPRAGTLRPRAGQRLTVVVFQPP